MNDKQKRPDANRDPLSGEPGAHPVGVGAGSAGGAAIGAAVGSVAGPVGTAAGAAIGGIAGAAAGKGVAERINPTVEDNYWRKNYAARPYVQPGTSYDVYQPAYRFGWEGRGRYGELNWEKAEPRLRADWTRQPGGGHLVEWEKASPAVKDAWDRLDEDHSHDNI
jgi:hypothetical protein